MVDLERVVSRVRDDLKEEYARNTTAAWERPFVCFIGAGGATNFLDGATSEEAIVAWLTANRNASQVNGVVVGRMVAKYSQTIKDARGNPQVLERGILVSGRLFTPEQTYVSITPCREHVDMRAPVGDTIANAEPQSGLPPVPGVMSPDKVEKVISPGGHVSFRSMQFGDEIIFDSRKGERCALDPIIDGVLATPALPAGGPAGV